MKPSNLPKDGNFSGRINKQILKLLKTKGVTAQHIIDSYIDTMMKVDIKVEFKRGPKDEKGNS